MEGLKALMHKQACDAVLNRPSSELVRYGATGRLPLHDLTTTAVVGPWWWPLSRRGTHLLAEAATTPRARERGGVVAVWMDEITQTHMCALHDVLVDSPHRVALLGYGNDGHGNPFASILLVHSWRDWLFGTRDPRRQRSCALALLELPQVVLMMVGHAEHMEWLRAPWGRWANESHPKLGYTPSLGVRLQEVFNTAPERCAAPAGNASTALFVCNNRAPWTPRPALLKELAATLGHHNTFPLSPLAWTRAAANAVVAFSPQGTGPDGFRHWELLALGTVPIVPNHPSMAFLFRDMPVLFHGTAGPLGRGTDEPFLTHHWLHAELHRLRADLEAGRRSLRGLTETYWHGRLTEEIAARV
jgi:hypothetical protein